MSAPVLVGCAAAALCLALPVVAATARVEAAHRADAAADAAALAAADAASGFAPGEPCALAAEVARAAGGALESCELSDAPVTARVTVRIGAAGGAGLGAVEGRARAGMPVLAGTDGPVGENGWAWPSDVRAVTQGFHDGYALDLAVSGAGALYAPAAGVVVAAGPDGGGVPGVCLLRADWWHGENESVVIRHEVDGRALYSSHNHIAPGSTSRLGIAVGDRVRAGQQVAVAGMSGCTSGPHTHFTLATTPTNAHPDVDPTRYIGRP